MPIDRICHIVQKEVFSSEEYLDNLDITQAESAADLEEDLNYIRSVLKKLGGGTAWFDPGNTEGLSQLEDDFQVEHFTYAEDPARAGQHKNIHALRVFSSGDIQTNASARIQQNLYFTDSWSDGWIIHPRYGTGYDFIHIAPRTGGVNEWGKGLKVYKADGRVEVLNYLRFARPESAGTLIADFGFYGYTLYRDNVGPLGGTPGNRLWLHGPSYTTGETGVVIGPRGGADYFSVIRLRAQNLRFEAPATGTFDIIQANLFNRDGWTRSRGFIFVDETSGHINNDGALYRYSGQAYLTVDDNFFIRDAGASTPGFHFDTNNHRLGINKTYPDCTLDVNGDICYSGSLRTSSRIYATNRTDGLASYKRNAISFLGPYKVEVWDGTTWVDQTATLAPQFANLTKNIGAYYQTTLANVGDQYRVRVYFDLGGTYWSAGTFRVDTQWTANYTVQIDLSNVSDFSSNVTTVGPESSSVWDSAIEIPSNTTSLSNKRYVRFDITVTRTHSTLSPRIRELAFFHEGVVGKPLSRTFPSHSWDENRRLLLYNRGSETVPALTWISDNNTGISGPAENQVAVVTGGQRSALFTDDGSTIDNHLQVGDFANKGTVYGDGNIYVAGEYHGILRKGNVIKIGGDWRNLVYSVTSGGVLEYDENLRAVKVTGRSVWIKIRLRLPITATTAVFGKVVVLYRDNTYDGRFYAGAICLDSNFNELSDDSISTYHYFIASYSAPPTPSTAEYSEYYGSIAGINDTTYNTLQGHYSFEKRTQYIDLVLITNYGGSSSSSYVYIRDIELFVYESSIRNTYNVSGIGNSYNHYWTSTSSSPFWIRIGRFSNMSTDSPLSATVIAIDPKSGRELGRIWIAPRTNGITLTNLVEVTHGNTTESFVRFYGGESLTTYQQIGPLLGFKRIDSDTVDIYVTKPTSDYFYIVSGYYPNTRDLNKNEIGSATNSGPSYTNTVAFSPIIATEVRYHDSPPGENELFLVGSPPGRLRPLGVTIEPMDANYANKDINVMLWGITYDGNYSSSFLYQIQRFSSAVAGKFNALMAWLIIPKVDSSW